jgi:hypothetical protein
MCPPLEKFSRKQADEYNVIFQGKVDSVEECSGQMSAAWFSVSRLFKGETVQRIRVSFDCVSDCRMQFKTGEEWIVYARYVKYGDLRVSVCGRSRKYAATIDEDYSIATNGIPYAQELGLLKDAYGKQEVKEKEKETIDPALLDRNLVRPSGTQTIWMLVISLVTMGILWYLFKKFWHKLK